MVSIDLDLREAIEMLPEKQRCVIKLRYDEAYPMTRKEVALQMGLGITYVQYLEKQALIRLRRWLEPIL